MTVGERVMVRMRGGDREGTLLKKRGPLYRVEVKTLGIIDVAKSSVYRPKDGRDPAEDPVWRAAQRRTNAWYEGRSQVV